MTSMPVMTSKYRKYHGPSTLWNRSDEEYTTSIVVSVWGFMISQVLLCGSYAGIIFPQFLHQTVSAHWASFLFNSTVVLKIIMRDAGNLTTSFEGGRGGGAAVNQEPRTPRDSDGQGRHYTNAANWVHGSPCHTLSVQSCVYRPFGYCFGERWKTSDQRGREASNCLNSDPPMSQLSYPDVAPMRGKYNTSVES
jgi:hypothetical protein